MIEVRIPTPDKEKLETLNRHAVQEGLEPINLGHFVYIELPKYKLAKLKKFIATNGIAKSEQIEEVISADFISPPEKIPLLIKFLEGINADFTISAYIKLQKKDFQVLIDFFEKNGFEEL